MNDLKFNKSSLDSEDQQRDALCHPPAERQNKDMPNARHYSQRLTRSQAYIPRHPLRPVHGVVIHEGSVTLKIELAEGKNSQSNEGDCENEAQQGVRRTATFCNTVDKNRQVHRWIFLITILKKTKKRLTFIKKNLSQSLMRQVQLQRFYLVRKRNKSLSLEVG